MSEAPDERPVSPIVTCADDSEADVIIALLRGRGIEGIPTSELSHSVFPVNASELAQVTILVDEDKAEEARKIIEEQRKPEDGSTSEEA